MARAARARRPLVIQPSAGLPESREGQVVYNETPDAMAARAPEVLDLGVSIVGGRGSMTPEHIRAIRRGVDAWREQGTENVTAPLRCTRRI